MKKLILHLGVHKTATTYVQSRIYNSKDSLSEAGVGCFSLDETRSSFTSQIKKNMSLSRETKKFLDAHDTILLSDENILGGTDKPTSQLVYPKGPTRLQFLLDALSPESLEAHITIRDPESYLVSRYCEYLRHYPFLDVCQYFDEFFVKEFSWLPLVEALEDVAGKKITVTAFENIFNDEDAYFYQLVGDKVDLMPAADNPSIRRSKISYEAYDMLLMM
ncbi:hypothetical protein SAMN05192556_1221, partial [Halomonas caseinilytica]